MKIEIKKVAANYIIETSAKFWLNKREQHYFRVQGRPFSLQKISSFAAFLSHVKISH